MKKGLSRNLLLAATVVTILNFSSCGKYEDGPSFSLRSKKARLTGEWEVVEINGQKPTGYKLEMEFEKSGDFKATYAYTYGSQTYSDVAKGEWEWESDKEEISIRFDGETTTTDFEIKRLTNKELWLEDNSGYEYELEKK